MNVIMINIITIHYDHDLHHYQIIIIISMIIFSLLAKQIYYSRELNYHSREISHQPTTCGAFIYIIADTGIGIDGLIHLTFRNADIALAPVWDMVLGLSHFDRNASEIGQHFPSN